MSSGHWQRFWGLRREERRVFLESWGVLPLVDLSLRVGSFESARRVLVALLAIGSKTSRLGVDPDRASWLVEAASRRHLWPIRCLPRAMVLEGVLRRSGLDCSLQIGARREAGSLSAHAWVEYRGRPVGEAEDVEESFPPLGNSGE